MIGALSDQSYNACSEKNQVALEDSGSPLEYFNAHPNTD